MPRSVTLRAVLLGLALVPFICWWSLRADLFYGGSELVEASLIVVVVFDLFLLVLLKLTFIRSSHAGLSHPDPCSSRSTKETALCYLLYILACTRFRAEAGPMLGYGPDLNPHRLLVDVAGTRNWSPQALTTLSYTQWFDSDYRTVAMPQQLEAFKLAEGARIPPTCSSRAEARAETLTDGGQLWPRIMRGEGR